MYCMINLLASERIFLGLLSPPTIQIHDVLDILAQSEYNMINEGFVIYTFFCCIFILFILLELVLNNLFNSPVETSLSLF